MTFKGDCGNRLNRVVNPNSEVPHRLPRLTRPSRIDIEKMPQLGEQMFSSSWLSHCQKRHKSKGECSANQEGHGYSDGGATRHGHVAPVIMIGGHRGSTKAKGRPNERAASKQLNTAGCNWLCTGLPIHSSSMASDPNSRSESAPVSTR
jgi:hypothetical protein